MGQERRRAGSNHLEHEEDRESSSADPESPESTGENIDSPTIDVGKRLGFNQSVSRSH